MTKRIVYFLSFLLLSVFLIVPVTASSGGILIDTAAVSARNSWLAEHSSNSSAAQTSYWTSVDTVFFKGRCW